MISSMASHKDKTFKLLSDNDLTAPLEKYNTPIDWNMCVFCEKDTSEKLQCPAEFTERFRGVGYATIAENLKTFNDLGCLPVNMKLTRLDYGDGIQQTLLQRKAKFHKSCRLKFNKNELQRASKRKRLLDDESTSSGSNKHCKRQNNSGTKTKFAKCFLCDKPASMVRRQLSLIKDNFRNFAKIDFSLSCVGGHHRESVSTCLPNFRVAFTAWGAFQNGCRIRQKITKIPKISSVFIDFSGLFYYNILRCFFLFVLYMPTLNILGFYRFFLVYLIVIF